MEIQTMGSPGKAQSLARQGSLYSVTLNEVQNHLGEPLNTMNHDDLLKNVFPQVVNQSASMNLDNTIGNHGSGSGLLSKKTVDEVRREIQQQKKGGIDLRMQAALGEMTLEEFLVKARMVADGSDEGTTNEGTLGFAPCSPWLQHCHQMNQQNQQSVMGNYAPSRSVPQVSAILDAAYCEGHQANVSSPLLGFGSAPLNSGRKRVAVEEVAEKTVERRKKRMIKNRESAARSRARKQARLSLHFSCILIDKSLVCRSNVFPRDPLFSFALSIPFQ